MSQLERRAVAASFILKFPGNDQSREPQVLLFQRSNKVRTYKYV